MTNSGIRDNISQATGSFRSGGAPQANSPSTLEEAGETDATQTDATDEPLDTAGELSTDTNTSVATPADAAKVKSRPLMPEGLSHFLKVQRDIWLASLALATFPLSIPLIMLAAYKGYFDDPESQSNRPAAAGSGSNPSTSPASSTLANKGVTPPVDDREPSDEDTLVVSYTEDESTASDSLGVATDETEEVRRPEGQPHFSVSQLRQIDDKHKAQNEPSPAPHR